MQYLSNINDMLVARFGPLGPVFALGALGIVLILLALPSFLKREKDPYDKIKDEKKGKTAAKDSKGPALRAQSGMEEKLDKFSTFLEPKSAEEMSTARLKMQRAGYKNKNAVRIFHFLQMVLGLGFLALGIIYTFVMKMHHDVSIKQMALYTLLPGAIGYYIPQYWVQRREQSRQQEIQDGFPDALDLMLVCIEAGQSLDQSITRVAKESRAGYPALADEFDMVANEVKAGKERVQVLKDMAERVGIPDVSSFVTTLVQSATYGTSIAEALRVYSAEMRDKRVMRAEEKANKLPTKLTLGTMMFTVPPLMIILIGPSIYGIASVLSMGAGFKH
jgi:tight adherence protein C